MSPGAASISETTPAHSLLSSTVPSSVSSTARRSPASTSLPSTFSQPRSTARLELGWCLGSRGVSECVMTDSHSSLAPQLAAGHELVGHVLHALSRIRERGDTGARVPGCELHLPSPLRGRFQRLPRLDESEPCLPG